jgi:hypothetical protein
MRFPEKKVVGRTLHIHEYEPEPFPFIHDAVIFQVPIPGDVLNRLADVTDVLTPKELPLIDHVTFTT